MTALLLSEPAKRELSWMVGHVRAGRRRTMEEFAEAEIIVPDGKHKGEPFRCDTQPFTREAFRAIDSGHYANIVATGPRQATKTLGFHIVPAMFHLFELEESAVCLVPNLVMAGDKWRKALRPAIKASRYRHLLPIVGPGSKDAGEIESIEFRNGATLKFMTAGGGDKSRAGYTSRVLLVTETDDMDRSSETSVEADKITQAMAITDSFGERARIYMECTVTVEQGRTWREYTGGTETRIAICCVHCRAWVTPEREHLRGWQDAESVLQARALAHFVCPACGAAWSEADRVAANRKPRLVHRGQTIKGKGEKVAIVGAVPETDTFALRWTAANNMFQTTGDTAVKEWRAHRDPDPENAEKGMCQFVWAKPYKPPEGDVVPAISIAGVYARIRGDTPRGVVPAGFSVLTACLDIGRWVCHWTACAFSADGSMHVVDYGAIEVKSREMGEEQAVLVALREFKDLCEQGWAGSGADRLRPTCALIDAAGSDSMVSAAYAFIKENPPPSRYRVSKGFGLANDASRVEHYRGPSVRNERVKWIGEACHISWLKDQRVHLVEVGDDYWKSWVHARIRTPATDPGAFSLFAARQVEHLQFAKHLTAEKQVEEFDPKRGRVLRWMQVHRNNHWLDTTKLCCVAGHMVGVRVVKGAPPTSTKPAKQKAESKKPGGWLGGGGGG